jgi:phosphate transport system protein
MAQPATLIDKKRNHLDSGVHGLGTLVLDALRRSVACMQGQDLDLARQIIEDDALINHRRRVLEQECLITLAAYKPAGEDLRSIGACLTLVSELERIGDYAADVARVVLRAGTEPFPAGPVAAIAEEAGMAIDMLAATLVVLGSGAGAEAARAAVAAEPAVDRAEDAVVEEVLGMMRADPTFATLGTYLLWIAHNYERVADRATNVAEHVVYIASGRDEHLN